jgi:transposase
MIQITPQMRILLAVEPVDFRKGIDGLAACCRQALGTDPLAGALVVFRSRSRRALKILVYDGQGFWLCQNMHASQCAVIESRESSLSLPSSVW